MDQVLIEIGKPIVKKSWKEIMFAKGLDSHIEDLKESKLSIEARLGDVDSLGSCSRSQQYMLDKLRQERDRIHDFFEERATRDKQRELMEGSLLTHVRLFFSPSNKFVARFQDARKVKDISKKLELVEKSYTQFVGSPAGTFINMVSGRRIQPETGPFPNTDLIVGRDGERDILISLLCNSSNDQESSSLSVVTIVGIGGQGKTTLAQYVYNDQRVIDCFEVRLWVFATPDVSLRELLEKIIADAMDEKPLNCEMSQLHRRIEKAIKGKKFLLVLDNMWDQDKLKENWQGLKQLLKFGATGSKVLVTTRCKEVARVMGPLDPYMLKDLAKKEAWLLFRHFAFNQRQEPGVEAIGQGIFKNCPKIPLVLKVVGQHLEAECHTIDQWKAFRDDLDKQSSFKGHNMIMETLKFSYDRLYEKLKPCVTYCSLFPKGSIYDADKMVHIWIALGYVEARSNKSLEDVGQEYVQMLADRGFFVFVQDGLGRILGFKMHDVLHDLMVSESKYQCKMVDSETSKIHENICHVSFCTGNKYKFDWEAACTKDTIKQQRLKSILIVPKYKYTCECAKQHARSFRFQSRCDEVISKLQDLKVLDIHDMLIEKVPRSLGKLIHLRYLDLSRNEMHKLPNSITQLVNLLSLDLSQCFNLQELPKDMYKLYKMRHLPLYGCDKLTHMPKGLGRLKNLQTLGLFVVGEGNGNVTGGLEELSDLKNLKGEITIIVEVESKYIVSQGRTAHLGRKDNLTTLNIKFMKSAKEDEMVLEALQPQGNKLRRIKAFGFGGKRLPSWMMNDRLHCELPNLVDIWITNYNSSLYNKVKEPEVDDQPWLRIECVNEHQLVECIPGFYELKKQLMMAPREVGFKMTKGEGSSRGLTLRSLTITRKLAPSPSLQQQHPFILFKTWFPNLEELQICGVLELEQLPEEFRDLSFLRRLVIYACPKLKAIPDWISTLTSLKEIIIEYCPLIETLPHQINTLPYLEEIFMPDFSQDRIITSSNKVTASLSCPKRLWRDVYVSSEGPNFPLEDFRSQRVRLGQLACCGGSPLLFI